MRKLYLLIALILVASLGLAACGTTATQAPAATEALPRLKHPPRPKLRWNKSR